MDKAFASVNELIKEEVILNGQVLKLSHLRNVYNENLDDDDNNNNDPANEITSHNLRVNLKRHSDLRDGI